jgi:anti-sigma regulatory factor (Ser/Thr protein kinase)
MLSEELSIPARFEEIEVVCDLVDKAARVAGFDENTNYACQLAAGEACENIICHGYKDEGHGVIEVHVRAEPGEMTIEILDTAPPFDPTSIPKSDVEDRVEDQVGGLGLPIIRRVMDEIEYTRQENSNRLILRKFRTSD